jgi:hypothetical protein
MEKINVSICIYKDLYLIADNSFIPNSPQMENNPDVYWQVDAQTKFGIYMEY